jgi:RNA polymerase sigma-70 factor (ECF subfamily)
VRDDHFDRLYAAHSEQLFSFLVYRTGDRSMAEDVLSDTFERALNARRLFDRSKASERTWLYTIALNLLKDNARRRAAEGRALERVAAPAPEVDEAALDRIEQGDDLSRALAALSAEEREAIALRYGADLTVPEIAKVTKERLTTIEGRVYRALRKLREELS